MPWKINCTISISHRFLCHFSALPPFGMTQKCRVWISTQHVFKHFQIDFRLKCFQGFLQNFTTIELLFNNFFLRRNGTLRAESCSESAHLYEMELQPDKIKCGERITESEDKWRKSGWFVASSRTQWQSRPPSNKLNLLLACRCLSRTWGEKIYALNLHTLRHSFDGY